MSLAGNFHIAARRPDAGAGSILVWIGSVKAASPRDALTLARDLPEVAPTDSLEVLGMLEKSGPIALHKSLIPLRNNRYRTTGLWRRELVAEVRS